MKKGLLFVLIIVLTVTMNVSAGGAGEKNDTPYGSAVGSKYKKNVDDKEAMVRTLYILTRPQASNPKEYETAIMYVNTLESLGFDAEVKVLSWGEMANLVWYTRDGTGWDITGWQMTARPERLDPDEFIYNLFHSSMAATGYNFVSYINKEYDSLAEEQRITIDPAKRIKLVKEAQQIIADDYVYFFNVNEQMGYVVNTEALDIDTVVEMSGLGIKNFWTYTNVEPKGGTDTLIINAENDIQAINPFYISGTVDSWITELVWDRVMRMGPDSLPQPYAAESVTWSSDTKVDIKLRDDMMFHDGTPVTAADIKFSYEVPMTLVNSEAGTSEAPMYEPFVSNIAAIDVKDDYNLTITLKSPSASFETATLAKLNIVPKHIWEPIFVKYQSNEKNLEFIEQTEESVIGSGPYKYITWKQGEEVVLEANTAHFDAPKVAKMSMRIVSNMESTLGMLSSNEINFLATYTGDADVLSEKVESEAKLEVVYSVDLGFKYFAPNLTRTPMSDIVFREALTTAFDMDLLVDLIYQGKAVKSNSVISPALETWNNSSIVLPYGDAAAAVELLKGAGYRWDKDGRIYYPEGQIEEFESAE